MVWTPAQTRIFLDHVAEHRLGALFTLLAYAGCRRGEACALHWTDIDLRRREATISTQLGRVGTSTVEGQPKTDAGIRAVALAMPVRTALSTLCRAQRAERRACDGQKLGFSHARCTI